MTLTYEEVCASNDKFRRLASYSNMPVNTYYSHSLFNFLPGAGTKKGHEEALKFVARNEDGKPKRCHYFITLGGDTGRGKTHLALGIGWHWIENDYGVVKYWQVSEFLDAMRMEYDIKPETEMGQPLKTVFEQAKEVGLLILDDIGAEKDTEWAADRLDQIINYRYLKELPTVFTTNLLFSQLPPRLSSRLKEGITVLLEGFDYREYKAKLRKDNSE